MPKAKSSKKNATENAKETVQTQVAETAVAAAASPAPATEAKLSPPPSNGTKRKPEIVRAESRANLVPINLDDEIRQLAYLFSERRGFAPGHETEDWLAAEHEVRERYHQHSAQHAAAHSA